MIQSYKNRWIRALRSRIYKPHNSKDYCKVGDLYNIYSVLFEINLHELNISWEPYSKDFAGNTIYALGKRHKDWEKEIKHGFFPKIELSINTVKNMKNLDIHLLSFDDAADWIEDNI